ncbi:MAG: NAD(P)-dependent alcohol dehydrogenase [Bacteroidota bacterium]
MKAAIIHKYGSPEVLKVEEVPEPQAKPSKILVEVHAAALNPKDILVRKGKFRPFSGNKFPMTLSSDYAGIVLNPGKSTVLKEGDKVFGMMNGMRVGSTAEKVLVKENELAKMPEGISYEEAAGIPLAGLTALQALRNLGKLSEGHHVCINGASGGVGTLAIQIAKCLGATVTSVSSERNLALCKSLGADEPIAYTQANWVQSLQNLDLFFDVFGNYSLAKVRASLTPKGRYISTLPRVSTVRSHVFTGLSPQKGLLVIVNSRSRDLEWLAQQVSNNKIRPIVDSVFSLAEIRQAHERVETKRSRGKVIIRIKP